MHVDTMYHDPLPTAAQTMKILQFLLVAFAASVAVGQEINKARLEVRNQF